MSAKQRVLDKIKKKKENSKRFKARLARSKGLTSLVIEFLDAMELMRDGVGDSAVSFDQELGRLTSNLESNIKAIDPEVYIKICWNDEDKVEDWKDLRVEAVHVIWSQTYLDRNPGSAREAYVDIGSLFLEGFLD